MNASQLAKWIWLALMLPIAAGAYENRCRNYDIGDTRALCRGQKLPYEQSRGRSNSRLTCSGNVDHFIRRPQEIPNYGEWSAAIASEGKKSQSAFDMRQKVAAIEWNGRIPYSVTEQWDWIECSLDTNGSECGYDHHQECHEEDDSYESCDDQNRCNTVHQTRTVCEDVATPRACYYDHNRSASMHCSEEAVAFTARYVKDQSWNPNNPDYNEFIPNKYDLLPGEMEDVQIYNNSGGSTRLSPSVVIGDAWNSYDTSGMSGSAIGAACKQDSSYTLNVPIVTGRRMKKPSPNAFRLPVDMDGKPLRPLVWLNDANTGVDAYPVKLKLSDTSASMVSLIARQSRTNADRQELKRELGTEGNKDKMADNSKAMDPFFKQTMLRVQLIENAWYGNSVFSPPFYIGDSETVVASTLSLSKLQSVRNSEMWEIPLDDADNGANIYKPRASEWISNMLGQKVYPKSNERYSLRFSMFQKGVPFYTQDCKENESNDRCINEAGGVFSKPLEVNFVTNKKYDNRPAWQKMNDFNLFDYFHRSGNQAQPGDDDANNPGAGYEMD